MPRTPKPQTVRARSRRKRMTTPEMLLWHRLKARDGSGIVFRRQHPIGPYVLDFYCAKARLCVEVDGAMHDADRDAIRDRWLAEHGVHAYRVLATDVYRDPDESTDGIRCMAEGRIAEIAPHHHSPSGEWSHRWRKLYFRWRYTPLCGEE